MKAKKKMSDQAVEPKQVTYWDYLQLDRLLDLQGGLEGDEEKLSEDEMHFIIVHQVFELWFKQITRELYLARDKMAAPRVDEDKIPFVVHHIKRVNIILGLAAKHFDVMETLTPQDFLVFRSKLGTASGFQSFQMREIELLLGLELTERKAYKHGDPVGALLKAAKKTAMAGEITAALNKAKKGQSVRDAVHAWLYRTPIQGSSPGKPGDEKAVQGFLHEYLAAVKGQNEGQIKQLLENGAGSDEAVIRQRFASAVRQMEQFLFAEDVGKNEQRRVKRIRAGVLFIESYRDLPLLSWPRLLLDTIVEMEELFTTFRFRHARMVERIIGRRVGTGGSPGVDYLDTTTKYRVFKELWAVRTLLLPKEALPKLRKPEIYGYKLDI